MDTPEGKELHLTDTEMKVCLDALAEFVPVDMPSQELRRRALKKLAAARNEKLKAFSKEVTVWQTR